MTTDDAPATAPGGAATPGQAPLWTCEHCPATFAELAHAEAHARTEHPAPGQAGPPGQAARTDPQGEPLTEHVPIRFPAALINPVKQLAAAEGMTASAWIRREVEREIARKEAAAAAAPQPAPGELSRVRADLLQEIAFHGELTNDILLNAPESYDGDEAADVIAVRYVRDLEAEIKRLRDEQPAPGAASTLPPGIIYVCPGCGAEDDDEAVIARCMARNHVAPGEAPELAAAMDVTVNGEPVPVTSGNALPVEPGIGAELARLRLRLGEAAALHLAAAAERDRHGELIEEIGVLAANAPEDGDSFGLLEEIAMKIAAHGVEAP